MLVPPVMVTGLDGAERLGRSGELLEVGEVVSTPEAGQALLTFFDGSSAELGPRAVLAIERVERGLGGETILELWQIAGHVVHRVTRLFEGSGYHVHTPSAVGMVRGTVFRTQVDVSRGNATVEVFRGQVDVGGRIGDPVSVHPGLLTQVQTWRAPETPAPNPAPAPPEEPPLVVPPPPGPRPGPITRPLSTRPMPPPRQVQRFIQSAVQQPGSQADLGSFTWAMVGGVSEGTTGDSELAQLAAPDDVVQSTSSDASTEDSQPALESALEASGDEWADSETQAVHSTVGSWKLKDTGNGAGNRAGSDRGEKGLIDQKPEQGRSDKHSRPGSTPDPVSAIGATPHASSPGLGQADAARGGEERQWTSPQPDRLSCCRGGKPGPSEVHPAAIVPASGEGEKPSSGGGADQHQPQVRPSAQHPSSVQPPTALHQGKTEPRGPLEPQAGKTAQTFAAPPVAGPAEKAESRPAAPPPRSPAESPPAQAPARKADNAPPAEQKNAPPAEQKIEPSPAAKPVPAGGRGGGITKHPLD